jgi:hypothetical protein
LTNMAVSLDGDDKLYVVVTVVIGIWTSQFNRCWWRNHCDDDDRRLWSRATCREFPCLRGVLSSGGAWTRRSWTSNTQSWSTCKARIKTSWTSCISGPRYKPLKTECFSQTFLFLFLLGFLPVLMYMYNIFRNKLTVERCACRYMVLAPILL